MVATNDGQFALPKNRYLVDDALESRIGLLVSYYTFDNRRFVPVRSPGQLRLRFADPDIPFRFSIQDQAQAADYRRVSPLRQSHR